MIDDGASLEMAKSCVETVDQKGAMAKMEKFKLINHIARTAVGTLMPFYSDEPVVWGGD